MTFGDTVFAAIVGSAITAVLAFVVAWLLEGRKERAAAATQQRQAQLDLNKVVHEARTKVLIERQARLIEGLSAALSEWGGDVFYVMRHDDVDDELTELYRNVRSGLSKCRGLILDNSVYMSRPQAKKAFAVLDTGLNCAQQWRNYLQARKQGGFPVKEGEIAEAMRIQKLYNEGFSDEISELDDVFREMLGVSVLAEKANDDDPATPKITDGTK